MMYSYLKPESVRVHPEATVRPWATCQIVGDAITFASALGYACVRILVHAQAPRFSTLSSVERMLPWSVRFWGC